MSTEYLEDKQPLNQVQYSAKDYSSYFDSILTRLREEYGEDYNDFASSSVGVMFVNLMAYAMGQLSWYLDRRSSESYLATARTLDSVTRLASQIGYKPKRASASSVDLTITFPALIADTVMSSGFNFSGPGGTNFQLMNDVLLSAGQTTAIITVSEGEQKTQSFTSDGEPAQQFILPGVLDGEYVADQSVRVFVNGLEWTEKDFLTYDKTNHFSVSYTTDPPVVLFGDGSAGNIPNRGADIRIDYRIIHAEEGNVRSNTITSTSDTLVVAGDVVDLLTITNLEPASGGSGPQSIAEIKRVAPMAFQAGGSAVTQQDYYALVNSFSDPLYGSVAKGFAGVTRQTSADEFTRSRLQAISNAFVNIFDRSVLLNTETRTLVESIRSLSSDSETIAVDTILADNLNSIISPALTNILNLSVQARNESIQVQSRSQRIVELGNDIQNLEIDLFGIGQLNPNLVLPPNSTFNSLDEIAVTISNLRNEIQLISQNIETSAQTIQPINGNEIPTQVNAIKDSVSTVGTLLLLVRDNSTGVVNNVNEILLDLTENADLVVVNKGTGDTSLVELSNHLDELFDDSCKANVVTVPILVEGREGFYQAPSRGLMRALQTYLDEVKEVTHLVRVVDGSTALVPANVNLKVEFNTSFVKSEIRAEIESGIDTLLRRRDFSIPLYLSDLYNVVELVDGVDHVNILIDSPIERIDNDGNLIVGELEVVTKGTITIEEVA